MVETTQYSQQLSSIQTQREDISRELDQFKTPQVSYYPGRGWKPTTKSSRQSYLEQELKRLNLQEKTLKEVEGVQVRREMKREDIPETRRQQQATRRELRTKASLAGEGSIQEKKYLATREKQGLSFSPFIPMKFKGQSQVPKISYEYKLKPGAAEEYGWSRTQEFRAEFFRKQGALKNLVFLGETSGSASERGARMFIGETFKRNEGVGTLYAYPSEMPRVLKFQQENAPKPYIMTELESKINANINALDFMKPTFTTQIQPVFQNNLVGKYQELEFKAGYRVERASSFVSKKTGLTKEKVAFGMSFYNPGTGQYQIGTSTARRYYEGLYYGSIEEVQRRPIKFAATTALFFALPGALTLVGKGLSVGSGVIGKGIGLAGKIPGVAKTVGFIGKTPIGWTAQAGAWMVKNQLVPFAGKAINIGLPTFYAGTVGYRILSQPTPYKKGVASGSILAGEVTPMALGGVTGAYAWPRVFGYVRTVGRKKVPIEDITTPKILAGIEKYPTANPKSQLSLFKSQKYSIPRKGVYELNLNKDFGGYEYLNIQYASGDIVKLYPKPAAYHTTASRLGAELSVQGGTPSEFEGLYISKPLSPAFLRIEPNIGLFGGSIFNPYGSPRAAYIEPLSFKYARSKFVGVVDGIPRYEWLNPGGMQKGVAYVPGVKTEIEAILLPGTKLKMVEGVGKFRSSWKGVRFPIDEFGVATTGGDFVVGKGDEIIGLTGAMKGKVLDYRPPRSYPLTTSPSYALSSSSSRLSSSSSLFSSYALSSSSIGRRGSSISSLSRSSIPSLPRSSSVSRPSARSYSYSRTSSSIGSSSISSRSSRVSSSLSSSLSRVGSSLSSSISRPTSRPYPSGSSRQYQSYKLPKYKPLFSKGKQKRTYSVFNPKYFSSVEASFRGIAGKKPSQRSIEMGLDIRPILR